MTLLKELNKAEKIVNEVLSELGIEKEFRFICKGYDGVEISADPLTKHNLFNSTLKAIFTEGAFRKYQDEVVKGYYSGSDAIEDIDKVQHFVDAVTYIVACMTNEKLQLERIKDHEAGSDHDDHHGNEKEEINKRLEALKEDYKNALEKIKKFNILNNN